MFSKMEVIYNKSLFSLPFYVVVDKYNLQSMFKAVEFHDIKFLISFPETSVLSSEPDLQALCGPGRDGGGGWDLPSCPHLPQGSRRVREEECGYAHQRNRKTHTRGTVSYLIDWPYCNFVKKTFLNEMYFLKHSLYLSVLEKKLDIKHVFVCLDA